MTNADGHPRAVRDRQHMRSGTLHHQGPSSHQVVRRRRKGDDTVDQRPAPVAQFPQPADAFQPAKELLGRLPLALTDLVLLVALVWTSIALNGVLRAMCGVTSSARTSSAKRATS